MYSVTRKFEFCAAHKLDFHKGKCKNLHGHTWKGEVEVTGPITSPNFMVIDFGELDEIIRKRVVDVYDHGLLNNVLKEPPTCENLLSVIVSDLQEEFKGNYPILSRVRLYESDNSFAEWKIN